MTEQLTVHPLSEGVGFEIDTGSNRRSDIEAKQGCLAALLKESGRDAILLLDPANVAWFTSGATPRGHIDPATSPTIFATHEARWLMCSNVDSQRFFDEELDGLGFQLKEWPWHWGAEPYLADLCANRRMLSDVSLPQGVEGDIQLATASLHRLRRVLSPYETACMAALGKILSSALEATGRTIKRHETEREVAGQIAFRLMSRGAQPLHIGAAADGRSRTYRRFGFTSNTVENYVVLLATARKYGLCASASRVVCFDDVPEDLRQEINATVRVSACYLASTWPDAVPGRILQAGRRIYTLSSREHEWTLGPQGHLTGREPVEMQFRPQTTDLLQPGWAVTWSVGIGASLGCDTYLVTEQGPKSITYSEDWPFKRVRIQGSDCLLPDALVR